MPSLLDWLIDNEPSFRKSRLPSLYSDLSVQKETNPEGYVANVQAWQAALTRAALAEQLPTEQMFILQTSDALVSALASPQYGRPSGLGAVIDDSVQEGKMIEVKDFAAAEQSIYSSNGRGGGSRSWLPSSPWVLLRWGVQQLVGDIGGSSGRVSYSISPGKLRTGSSLVIVPALEEISKRVEAWVRGRVALTDRILSREEFTKQLPSILQTSHALFTPQDVEILLRYLSRDRQLLSYNESAIKFKEPFSAGTTLQSQPQPEPITAEDTSIANLKQLISNLNGQCTRLESTISTQQARAASFVTQKNKTSALAALRSKKRTEQALAQRTATLQQLEDVYHSIEQAADQISIVETLQSSAATLKSLNKKVGSVERVEDVIDELREQMGKTDEVSAVLQEPLSLKDADLLLGSGGEAEIDDELEAMERQEQERQERQHAEQTSNRLNDPVDLQVPQTVPDKDDKINDNSDTKEPEVARSVEEMDALHLSG